MRKQICNFKISGLHAFFLKLKAVSFMRFVIAKVFSLDLHANCEIQTQFSTAKKIISITEGNKNNFYLEYQKKSKEEIKSTIS